MKRRVLFIDRDGTVIVEPPEDKQVDSLSKLEFIPGVITNLRKISTTLPYDLVMVTNQDGLGTESFPEHTFWPAHEKMLATLKGEQITFKEILIDRTRPEDDSQTRKPGIALVKKYLDGIYDLDRSFVIGDRSTDIAFAKNMGAKSIFFGSEKDSEATVATSSWDDIYRYLRVFERKATVERITAETKIKVEIAIDGGGQSEVSTSLGFFDHMLAQIARHSGCFLSISVDGDLHVDEHHTIEDTGLALGEAVARALGNKIGIARYGFVLPMDDCLAQVTLDFSGRPWMVWDADFKREKIGDMPTEMFFHFFKSFSDAAKCNLNIKAEGNNEHHKIESIFKAFAKTLGQAWKLDYEAEKLPSTKEAL